MFVPLKSEHFDNFVNGSKRYEIRACSRGFTEKFVYEGRRVVLSDGYGKQRRLEGNIGKVVIGSLEEIFGVIDYLEIVPEKLLPERVMDEIKTLLKNPEKYTAFEVILDEEK